jgi:hypothetical protein
MQPQRIAIKTLLMLQVVAFVLAQQGPNSNIGANPDTFNGETVTFALHEAHPFVFYDDSKSGNEQFTGVTVDLIDMLSRLLNFNYVLTIDSTDPENPAKALEAVGVSGTPGSRHPADVAAGALHITSERHTVLHWSQPYFDTGYVVVVPRPPETINLWAFFSPFSGGLWGCVVLELFIIAILFFLMEAPFLTVQEERDSDLVDSPPLSFLDALYWSISALTCTLDKVCVDAGYDVVFRSILRRSRKRGV